MNCVFRALWLSLLFTVDYGGNAAGDWNSLTWIQNLHCDFQTPQTFRDLCSARIAYLSIKMVLLIANIYLEQFNFARLRNEFLRSAIMFFLVLLTFHSLSLSLSNSNGWCFGIDGWSSLENSRHPAITVLWKEIKIFVSLRASWAIPFWRFFLTRYRAS